MPTGDEVRVSGKGVQTPRKTGDLVGRVQIRVPKKPSMHEKHAAKEFDKMCGDFAADIANEREA